MVVTNPVFKQVSLPIVKKWLKERDKLHAQKTNRGNKKWQEKNKDYANYISARSRARSFIKNKATLEDIEEFKKLIEEREKFLKSEDTFS